MGGGDIDVCHTIVQLLVGQVSFVLTDTVNCVHYL